jgi:hypothetical protein
VLYLTFDKSSTEDVAGIVDGRNSLDIIRQTDAGKGLRRHTFVPAHSKLLGIAAVFLLHEAHPNPVENGTGSGRLFVTGPRLGKRFWTLSVWENEVVLTDFIHNQPHREAMITLRRNMAGTQFALWKIKGAAVPPSWSEAMERFNAHESKHVSMSNAEKSSR